MIFYAFSMTLFLDDFATYRKIIEGSVTERSKLKKPLDLRLFVALLCHKTHYV